MAIAFGFGLQNTFGIKPIVWAELYASLDMLIGAKPPTLAGFGRAGGSLNLGPFSLGVEAQVAFMVREAQSYFWAEVTGRIELFFFDIEGTVTISFGDLPKLTLPPPDVHPLDLFDKAGNRVGSLGTLTDDTYRVVAPLVVLGPLVFSKHFYLASISIYYTFFLMEKFHVSVRNSQVLLFVFLAAAAVGTLVGGPIGDRIGRKYVIWCSILGVLPFTLLLPYVDLAWTVVLSVVIGLVLSSAFSAIVVYGQELLPGKVGMINGLFFGFAFGIGGSGAAVLGWLADQTSITFVYRVVAFLPAVGLLTVFLPNIEPHGWGRRVRAGA